MSADYQATEKLVLNFGAAYSVAESGMHGISHVAPFDATGTLAAFYNADGDSSKTVGTDAGWENRIGLVETYSDLEYTQLDLTVGGSYDFTERLYASASMTYSEFDSKEDYVFGDESGSAYFGYLGVGYRF
jgi:hypothetical protein